MNKKAKNLSKNFKEKYYICPSCGELSTYSKQLEEASQGGMPYCYCEFGGERGRIFIDYKKINKKLWEELKNLKINKLRLREYKKYKTERIKK
ncbi:MAG: hypothetical protein QT05_C0049G0004 [archaeon GW2011_AR13]|nr:MAG: hypothetical protein QT05_C0049G0004 [archaeon GW2011_AR13]HIG94299.1 hypothetical protein [Nanoarchaeota archaeon]HIH63068.1 hypothetical protein [Nanoarchaeota archaeon]HIJ09505.1 hypothetical protein [Nanoarchaeota archaeon]